MIEEEAYSDILDILYRSGSLTPIGTAGTDSLPAALKDAMYETMSSQTPEIVPDSIRDIFTGMKTDAVVTNGEIFPTNTVPVFTGNASGAADITTLKWGFPQWKGSGVIINARAETALEKPMFRKSLLERRCVIMSSGFFEWGCGIPDNMQIGMFGIDCRDNYDYNRKRKGRKTKYLLRIPDSKRLYMAGFWNMSGEGCPAFVILTTNANSSVAPVHNRMPVILSPDERDDWLHDTGFMEHVLLRPGPALDVRAA